MSMPRYNPKRDISEKEVVKALQDLGVYVYRMDQPVDLLVSFKSQMYLIEVKTGKRKFNANQEKFVKEWTGPPVIKLTSSQDAIDWFISITSNDRR